jgi:hypothetical protein
LFIHAHTSYYGLKDRHEEYTLNTGKITSSNTQNSKLKFSLFQSEIKKITERNFKEGNFAIKLFPRMLVLDSNIIHDVSYFYNIKKYDHVYFLDRDIVDSVCSFMYGIHIKSFSFTDLNKAKETFADHSSLTININDPDLNFYIYESVLSSLLKEFLIKNNITHTTLDYHDIPKFVDENYPLVYHKTIDNQLDYKKVITNYDEICDQIKTKYEIYLAQNKDLNLL